MPKSELARRFGISRRTIYHWIEDGQLDRNLDENAVQYSPRPPVPRKIDPYKGIVTTTLEEFPLLTAKLIVA